MGWIDSDAHVVETTQTWDYLSASEQRLRPLPVFTDRENSKQRAWLIDGKIGGLHNEPLSAEEFAELSRRMSGRQMATTKETREMGDVEARVAHMNELGIEIQVVYPTFFLGPYADRPQVEVALCGAYNRWMADVWKQGKGRIRWMCVLPFLSISDALDQMRFGKEHGACGIFMRPIEGHRRPVDPYFYPVYEQASQLDLCIGFHQSNGSYNIFDFFRPPQGGNDFFVQYRMFCVAAFFSIVRAGLPEQFPHLRMGIIECAASWLPWLLTHLHGLTSLAGGKLPEDLLKEYRLFVTCQNDDDVPYLVNSAGEDNLLVGTDYGHRDFSTQIDALRLLTENGRLSPSAVNKIVDDNGRTFYGLEQVASRSP